MLITTAIPSERTHHYNGAFSGIDPSLLYGDLFYRTSDALYPVRMYVHSELLGL